MIAKSLHASWLVSTLILIINIIGLSNTNSAWIVDYPFEDYSHHTLQNHQLNQSNQLITPTVTIIFNLPIIEQTVPTPTPVPIEGYPGPETEIDTIIGTPTPTPLPVQTGSVNIPIVIGALVIIIVIVLAWFFVGYLPGKNKQ